MMDNYINNLIEEIIIERKRKLDIAIIGGIEQIINDNKICTTIELNEAYICEVFKNYEQLKAEIDGQDVEIMRLKHEIERLKKENEDITNQYLTADKYYEDNESKAVKKFAERLKEVYKNHLVCSFNVLNNEIDNLVEEMVGD